MGFPNFCEQTESKIKQLNERKLNLIICLLNEDFDMVIELSKASSTKAYNKRTKNKPEKVRQLIKAKKRFRKIYSREKTELDRGRYNLLTKIVWEEIVALKTNEQEKKMQTSG